MTRLKATLLEDRGVIAISGEEAHSFLQALVSNDVELTRRGEAVYAALLTPQGKYLFDFFIIAHGDRLLLDCDGKRADDLVKRLGFYKLRAKIAIANLSETLSVAALWDGERPTGVAAEFIFADPRLKELGYRAILPRTSAHEILSSDAELVTAADYRRHRLSLGVGNAEDFEPDRSFPLELNFDALNGIDFAKGCFIGQEVTSRVKRRGSVRKRLISCVVDGPLPAPNTIVTAGGREVGTVFSGDDNANIVLALLRLDLIKNTALAAGDARLTPQPAAWLQQPIWEAEHGADE